jgi:RNA polymerase sigma-70 factor (ECF subfamily)
VEAPAGGGAQGSRRRAARGLTLAQGSPTDAQLVAGCRAGDHEAWRLLVDRFSRYVFAICVQGFRLPEHDAEDVFQDVWARAYERLGQLRDDDAVRPWLAQLTRRACLDRLRAGSRVEPVAELEGGSEDEELARIEDAWFVRELLEGLSANCREILDRFFCRDQSYATIASEVGIPPGTIASRISRCLRTLREMAEGRNDAPAASGGRT